MGGSNGFDPVSIISKVIFTAVGGGLEQQPESRVQTTTADDSTERLAEEREAAARRAEDRRAEEAVLKAQARKQQLSLGRLSTALGESETLAGQSMHAAASLSAPQLKEKLGQ